MTSQKWEKLGRIFDPKIIYERGLSAALMPIPLISNDNDNIRVYYSPRDKENRSEVHFFEMSLDPDIKIESLSDKALLKHGKLGTFDDSGMTPGNISEINGEQVLYYTGWNLLKNVPMNNSIGIAKFDEFGQLQRYGDGPIMTRNLREPYSCASPFVMYDNGKYKMWYASMDKWELDGDAPKHYYNIKYAESENAIDWIREGRIAIDYENDDEYAFGRPWIIKEDNKYKMWYAYRGDYYKIGYAESVDGISWERQDAKVGIEISDSGWDSEMIEYPSIFDYKGNRYMLYNGNGYGKTGIGLAILRK